MKTEKINLTKLLKIGILFYGISFLLWNCENEEKTDFNPQKTW
jgi:hypothetical protein